MERYLNKRGNVKGSEIFVLVLIFLLLSPYAGAQVSSGFDIGINLTSMQVQKEGVNIRSRTPVAIHFGAVYELPLKRKFALQSGAIFTAKGADFKIDGVDYSYAPAYFEIPLNLSYTVGRSLAGISFFAGPYLAFAFGGYKLESDGRYNNLALGRRPSDDLRRFDTGINLGTRIRVGYFTLAVQYGSGLRDVSPKDALEIKNKVISVSVGTLIPGKKK